MCSLKAEAFALLCKGDISWCPSMRSVEKENSEQTCRSHMTDSRDEPKWPPNMAEPCDSQEDPKWLPKHSRKVDWDEMRF